MQPLAEMSVLTGLGLLLESVGCLDVDAVSVVICLWLNMMFQLFQTFTPHTASQQELGK